MSIIRPAVTKLFSRWSEAIAIGLGVIIFGYLTIRSTGVILPLVYGAITLICAVTLFVAVRRARILGETTVMSGHVQFGAKLVCFAERSDIGCNRNHRRGAN